MLYKNIYYLDTLIFLRSYCKSTEHLTRRPQLQDQMPTDAGKPFVLSIALVQSVVRQLLWKSIIGACSIQLQQRQTLLPLFLSIVLLRLHLRRNFCAHVNTQLTTFDRVSSLF